ncbi:hypothetical protein ACFUC2_07820 [[Kitasatospora] papulosa]|uniref:hypothetical protein n=1 Tax=[Kitasatospora] papulosa TaxID=1464011 RepID=UPI00362A0DFF
MATDVFSQAVRERNQAGMTFSQMEARTWEVGDKEGSRSSAWWNNMSKWFMDTPPAPKYIPGIAAVLEVPERRVNELIAEQWYGVSPRRDVPREHRPLVSILPGVAKTDILTLMDLARRLAEKNTEATQLAQLKAQLAQIRAEYDMVEDIEDDVDEGTAA